MRSKLFILVLLFVCISLAGCPAKTQSRSGVTIAAPPAVKTLGGLTAEQTNIRKRTAILSDPNKTFHIYVFSTSTGRCLFYSQSKRKTTSSSKRLTPKLLHPYESTSLQTFRVGKDTFYTKELMSDDGTFGSSTPYTYWFDLDESYKSIASTGGTATVVLEHKLGVIPMINLDTGEIVPN